MKKKQQSNPKYHLYNPSINYTSPNEIQINQNQIKNINLNIRSKTPFYRKKSAFSPEEENNLSLNNKSINSQTFIYNSINFNNQGLFNNINNNNNKRRKSGGNCYLVNNGILGFFETMKKSRSISKQKNNNNGNNKFMNIINKLSNVPLFYKSMSKNKNKNSKNNSYNKNDNKKKININLNINNTNNNFHYKKNKQKLMTNINNTNNIISHNNYSNKKINHILSSSNTKPKKDKEKLKKNNNNNTEIKINKINHIKNIQFIDNSKKKNFNKNFNIENNNNMSNINITEHEKKILKQIENLILNLLNNCISSKNIIIKEIEKIFKNIFDKYNINYSKKSSKNNLKIEEKNKDNMEKELNILNKQYNKIKEENINLKYIINEKTTAFEDVKNSLKNFQLEINQLKNNTNINHHNINSFRNKNEDYNIDNSLSGNISLGVEMKNIKLNLSKLNQMKSSSKKETKNTETNTNKDSNNIFNCNNYSFGQNNSFEIINLENSQKYFLNSNRSLDPLSLTFHEQTINHEEEGNKEIKENKEVKDNDFTPSLRYNTEILIRTGMRPSDNNNIIKDNNSKF